MVLQRITNVVIAGPCCVAYPSNHRSASEPLSVTKAAVCIVITHHGFSYMQCLQSVGICLIPSGATCPYSKRGPSVKTTKRLLLWTGLLHLPTVVSYCVLMWVRRGKFREKKKEL